MESNIRFSMIEYFAYSHAVTFGFGDNRESVSKTKYYVNLIR